MRSTTWIRPLLRGCVAASALVALSCAPETEEETVTGPPSLAITDTSLYDIVRVGAPMTIDGSLSD